MKRYLGALLAAGMVFALVLGSAAALDVNRDAPVQVGVLDDLTCDDSVDVHAGFQEHGTVPPGEAEEGEEVRSSNFAAVSNLSNACDGAWITVIALDGEDNEIGFGQMQIPDNESTTVNVWWHENPDEPAGGDNREGIDPLHIEEIRVHLS